jgi:class 3 adenylate cyclase
LRFSNLEIEPNPNSMVGSFWVGIGIATGTALATNMGSANCNDQTMVGDRIDIASRLQGKAATSEILVTAEAYKPISGVFADASRVEYLLKEISHPVAAPSIVSRASAMT